MFTATFMVQLVRVAPENIPPDVVALGSWMLELVVDTMLLMAVATAGAVDVLVDVVDSATRLDEDEPRDRISDIFC